MEILAADQVWKKQMHQHAKFRQNWPNNCGHRDLSIFQDGGHPTSFNFQLLEILTANWLQRS